VSAQLAKIDDVRRRHHSAADARVPPHDLHAEESILGAMLLAEEAVATGLELLSADDFYKPAHAHVFEAITTVHSQGQPVDPVVVADALRRAGQLEAVGGPAILITLQSAPPSFRNAGRYAEIVRGHSLQRSLAHAAQDVYEAVLSRADPSPALDRLAALRAAGGTADAGERPIELIPASAVTPEHTRWLWENRIPLRGLTLAVGMEGRGKTTMIVALVAQLTRGSLVGDLRGKSVPVVYVTAEDSLSATVVPRLTAAGADLSLVHFVNVGGISAGGLTIPGDLPCLSTAMARVGARLLVLDPVVAHLHSGLDSHKDQQVRQALAPLARWADGADGAVLGVMHLNKGLGADVLDRVNGSRGFTAAARSVLTIGDDPQDATQRVVAVGKANLAPTDVAALRFRIEGRTIPHPEEPIATSGVAWLGEADGVRSRDLLAAPSDDDPSARDEAAAWLADQLSEGPVPSTEVKSRAEKAGFAWATVRRAQVSVGVKAQRWGRPGENGGWCWALAAYDYGPEDAHETPKVLTPET